MRLVGRGGGLQLGLAPEAFEAWVGKRFRDLGYEVELTLVQGDHGVDLILTRAEKRVIVQCKDRPRGSVGEPVLRDLFGALHHFGADRAFLVTTGQLTKPAREWLAGKPIEAWDAARLREQWEIELAHLAEHAVAQPVPPHGAPPSPSGDGRARMAWYVYTEDQNTRWAVELPRSIGGQPALGFEPLTDPTIAPLPRTLRMRYVSLTSREPRPRYLRRVPFGLPSLPANAWSEGLEFVSSTGRRTTWDIRLNHMEMWGSGCAASDAEWRACGEVGHLRRSNIAHPRSGRARQSTTGASLSNAGNSSLLGSRAARLIVEEGNQIMPIAIRKLTPEEALRVFPRRRQQNVSEYVNALHNLEPGEVAEIERQDLSDRVIKRRFGQAAKQLGYRLKWSRQASPELLYFQVVGTAPAKASNGRRRRRTAAPEPAPPTEPAAPKPGRGRRRRAA